MITVARMLTTNSALLRYAAVLPKRLPMPPSLSSVCCGISCAAFAASYTTPPVVSFWKNAVKRGKRTT